jgi:hypothetical protein
MAIVTMHTNQVFLGFNFGRLNNFSTIVCIFVCWSHTKPYLNKHSFCIACLAILLQYDSLRKWTQHIYHHFTTETHS